MIPTLQRYLMLASAVLAVAAVIGCAFFRARSAVSDLRADAAEQRAAQSEAQLRAVNAARAQEQAAAARVAVLADQYEQDKLNAEAAGKRTADDLRAGNIKLRQLWQGCQANRVPGTAAAPGEPDAAAEDRIDGARDLVRAAAEADAQIRGLQEFIRAERK